MAHKYLEEVGLSDSWYTQCLEPEPEEEKFRKEREVYGFDSRETYELDVMLCTWLYERLRRLIDVAFPVIDYEAAKVTIPVLQYTGKTKVYGDTQERWYRTETRDSNVREAILLATRYLEDAIRPIEDLPVYKDRDKNDWNRITAVECMQKEKASAAIAIVAEILPHLGW